MQETTMKSTTRYLLAISIVCLSAPALAREPLRTLSSARPVRVSNAMRTRADLTVSAMGRPRGAPSSCLGSANRIVVHVTNRGGVATRPTKVRLQIFAAKPGVRSIPYTRKVAVPRIPGGQTRVVTFSSVRFPDGFHSMTLAATADVDTQVSESSESNNALRQTFQTRNVSTCGARSNVRQINPSLDLAVDTVYAKTGKESGSNKCKPRVRVRVRNRTGAQAGRPTITVTMKQRSVSGAPTHRKVVRMPRSLGPGQTRDVLVSFNRHDLFNGLKGGGPAFAELEYDVVATVSADPAHPETRRDNNRTERRISVYSFLGQRAGTHTRSKASDFTRRCPHL